jgi:hypothetical protein
MAAMCSSMQVRLLELSTAGLAGPAPVVEVNSTWPLMFKVR